MDEKQFNDLVEKVGKEAAEKIKSQVEAATKEMATKADLADLKKTLEAVSLKAENVMIGEKSVQDIISEQGSLINQLQEKNADVFAQAHQSIEMQVKSYLEANKEAIAKIGNKTKADLPEMKISLKAAAAMLESTNLGGSAYLPNAGVAPGIIDLVRIPPSFWTRLRKGRTRLNPYVWINKVNPDGNAAFIGEGVTKPLTDFELETQSSVPKKVAARERVSTELLNDVEGMATMIADELMYNVMTAANAAVLTGTASATSPAGITTVASAYSLSTISTSTPNIYDAIVAGYTQIRSLNFTGTIEAYLNPIDLANMKLEKGTDGHYISFPYASPDGMTVHSVRVYEDNNIAVGKILMGDMSLYKILMYEEFSVRFGLDGTDWSENMMTAIGEMRFHQLTSSNHTGAWIYDDIADILAALLPAVE